MRSSVYIFLVYAFTTTKTMLAAKQGVFTLTFPFGTPVHFLDITTRDATERARGLYEFSCSTEYFVQCNLIHPIFHVPHKLRTIDVSRCRIPSSAWYCSVNSETYKSVIGSFATVISCDPSMFDGFLIGGNVQTCWRMYFRSKVYTNNITFPLHHWKLDTHMLQFGLDRNKIGSHFLFQDVQINNKLNFFTLYLNNNGTQ